VELLCYFLSRQSVTYNMGEDGIQYKLRNDNFKNEMNCCNYLHLVVEFLRYLVFGLESMM
jgi:hypothetical protein